MFTHLLHNGSQSLAQLRTYMAFQPLLSFGMPITTTLLVSVTSQALEVGVNPGANSTLELLQSAASVSMSTSSRLMINLILG